jgi:hypothetical protein
MELVHNIASLWFPQGSVQPCALEPEHAVSTPPVPVLDWAASASHEDFFQEVQSRQRKQRICVHGNPDFTGLRNWSVYAASAERRGRSMWRIGQAWEGHLLSCRTLADGF